MKPHKLKLIAALVAMACGVPAHAVLERVGPNNPAPGVASYPAWYQDTTGIALEFCDPKNQAEVDGGWCLLLPGDVTLPEVFPVNYFDEHFYFSAGASMTTPGGGTATLVLAEEAAFAAGAPVPGDQITFSRIRVKLTNLPATGTYRFIHPYGEEVLEGVAGDRIFFTDDVGISCPPGQFECSLGSRLGPFLLPAATPGGLELPPIAGPVPGKLYIADPNRLGPVTGSALPNFTDSKGQSRNHNIFRIEGPAGSTLSTDPVTGQARDYIETTNFSLMGRLFTGAMPGRVNVDRASYTRNASGNKVDVFATAFPTTRGRLPAQPAPAAVAPELSFFAAPCAGTVDATGNVRPPYSAPVGVAETPMLADNGRHWGQVQPAAIPTGVCVRDISATDAAGNPVPVFAAHGIADEVAISQASYDASTLALTVAASSSDETVPPTLSATFGAFRGELVNGQLVVPGVTVPPAVVRVQSSAQGSSQLPVTTGFAAPPVPPVIPVATGDAFSFAEDSGAQTLAVLSNDTNATGGTVSITTAPALGTATVNPDGTVTYTPLPNAAGADSFAYSVTVGAQASNVATVTLAITPVDDAPTAVNDTASTSVNVPVTINVLANDTDPDGAADLVAAANVTQPTPAGATLSVAGGLVTFNATAAGTYTFTYQAQDAALATSVNAATVTVQVAAGEALNIRRAEYVVSKNQLLVEGTVAPAAVEGIVLAFVNAAGTNLGAAGAAVTDAGGRWAVNRIVPRPAGATAVKAVSGKGTVLVMPLTLK
jgi:hypothetical protein